MTCAQPAALQCVIFRRGQHARLLVVRAEVEALLARGGAREVGRDQVALAGFEHAGQVAEGLCGSDLEPHAEKMGELPRQFHLRAGGAVGPDVVGAGAVAGQHHEAAPLFDLFELGRAVLARRAKKERHQYGKRKADCPSPLIKD